MGLKWVMKRSSPVHRPVERKVNWSIWKIVLQSQQCSAFFKQLEKDTFASTTILIKVEAEGDVLKKISKILGKYLYRSICFDKVKGWRPLILLIRDPDTGVFIWILWNFQCHYFCRRPLCDRFCQSKLKGEIFVVALSYEK